MMKGSMLKYCLYFGIFYLSSFPLCAQKTNPLDSLKQELSIAESTIDSAKIYHLIAKSLLKSAEFESAMRASRLAINSTQKAQLDSLMVKSYVDLLASSFHAFIPTKDLFSLADTVSLYAERVNDTDALIQVYLTKGIVLDDIGQDEKALESLSKAITLVSESSNKQQAVPVYNALGNLLKNNHQIDKAIPYYEKALYIADTSDWQLGKSVILNNLANTYTIAEKYEEAERIFKESIAIKKSINNKTNLSVSYCQLASLYEETGQWDLAYQYVAEGLNLAESVNYYNGTKICMLVLADVHSGQAKINERIKILEEAQVLISERSGDYSDDGLAVYEALHEAYKDKGEYEKAYEVLAYHAEITDSLITKRNNETMEKLEIQFQLKELEMQKALLEEQQQKSVLESNQRKIINYSIVFFTLFLGFLSIVYARQKTISNYQLDRLVKKKTEELHETVNELEEANEELTQFAYITSHDLKEPLRNINGFTTLLARKLDDQLGDKEKILMDSIKRSTHQMNRLIEDVMQFSLVSHKELHFENVSLSNIIDEVKDNLSKQIKEKNAQIVLSEDATFSSSHTHLLLILTNLCQNGIHYNESVQPLVSVRPVKLRDGWRIEVTDNGIGIAREFREKIFIMFKRLHPRSKYEGTGLGLPITKRLVKQLRGEISLKSRPGMGSKFMVFLPFQTQQDS
jgi:signal transduction histidine kinase